MLGAARRLALPFNLSIIVGGMYGVWPPAQAVPLATALAAAVRMAVRLLLSSTASGAPLRMAYLYIPNGVNLAQWRPQGSTASYKLGETRHSNQPMAGAFARCGSA